jgi:hypothetical protein
MLKLIGAAVAVGAGLMILWQLPDIRRYLKIMRM